MTQVQARLLTIKEAAEYLGVCRSSVYNLMNRGELQRCKFGASVRFDIADLEALVEASKS